MYGRLLLAEILEGASGDSDISIDLGRVLILSTSFALQVGKVVPEGLEDVLVVLDESWSRVRVSWQGLAAVKESAGPAWKGVVRSDFPTKSERLMAFQAFRKESGIEQAAGGLSDAIRNLADSYVMALRAAGVDPCQLLCLGEADNRSGA